MQSACFLHLWHHYPKSDFVSKLISGIQQIGIGVPDVHKAWKWYRKAFGIDVRMFEEAAEAALMTRYTGDEVHARQAILALHMGGGAGMEIWQFTSREPQPVAFEGRLGDTGIFMCKIKCKDADFMHEEHLRRGIKPISPVQVRADGRKHYYLNDPHGYVFEMVESDEWFGPAPYGGGVGGAVIGVSDIDKALVLYSGVLGYDLIALDESGKLPGWHELPGGEESYRRVVLRRTKPTSGPFSQLLGGGEIELVQALDRKPRNLFENRYWGDLGYIHICWDIRNMEALGKELEEAGFPFTVNSASSFDMGQASGQFTYVEDPDSTWIEFVETHKIPISQKMNWYLDTRKRAAGKALPKWMLRMLRFNRVKD